MMTLDELLQQAKEKADAATAGPWDPICQVFSGKWQAGRIRNHAAEALTDRESAEFCAFARTALPLLVKIVERQDNALRVCKKAIVRDDELHELEACDLDIRYLIDKEMKP